MIFKKVKELQKISIAVFVLMHMAMSQASTEGTHDPKYMPSFDFHDHDQGLHIFTIPIMRKIAWKHPGPALWSIVSNTVLRPPAYEGNSFVQSAFGHMIARVKCVDENGRLRETWSGMSGQNNASVDREYFIKEKIGLTALFKSYLDGEIEPSIYNQHRVAKSVSLRNFLSLRRTKFIYFPLSRRQCSKVYDYYTAFEKRSYDHKTPHQDLAKKDPRTVLHFGFKEDSYLGYLKYKRGDSDYRLGGGCASYAVSFLKVANIYDPYFDLVWKRQLYIPKALMGGVDPQTGIKKEVNVTSLLVSPKGWTNWTTPRADKVPLSLYDPEKIWDFISETEKCLKSSRSCSANIRAWLDQSPRKAHLAVINTQYNLILRQYPPQVPIYSEAPTRNAHTLEGIAFENP